MSGNEEGATKGAITKKSSDPEFFKTIGAMGGAKNKGRKLTTEHKRKLSESRKRAHARDTQRQDLQ